MNRAGPSLIVAMGDPSNIYAVDDLKFLTGYNIEPVVASEPSIREAIERYYAEKGPSLDEILGEVDERSTSPSRKRTRTSTIEGGRRRAGGQAGQPHSARRDQKAPRDIHVEPYEKDFRVRFRIDGVLYEVMKPPMKLKNAITSPSEDHGRAGHRRAPAPAGRTHQDQDRRRQGDGLPRQRLPDAVRREGGAPASGQVEPPARHDQARVRSRAAQAGSRKRSTGPTGWCW